MRGRGILLSGLLIIAPMTSYGDTFYTLKQAKQALIGDMRMTAMPIILTESQRELIEDASDTRVLSTRLNAYKTDDGGWFIVDQVVGKHEMIDLAIAIEPAGKIKSLLVMKYVESYGGEVRQPKWLAQFIGRDTSEHLKLGEQIDALSGATLSSRHITDGINRWVHLWDIVLKNK